MAPSLSGTSRLYGPSTTAQRRTPLQSYRKTYSTANLRGRRVYATNGTNTRTYAPTQPTRTYPGRRLKTTLPRPPIHWPWVTPTCAVSSSTRSPLLPSPVILSLIWHFRGTWYSGVKSRASDPKMTHRLVHVLPKRWVMSQIYRQLMTFN